MASPLPLSQLLHADPVPNLLPRPQLLYPSATAAAATLSSAPLPPSVSAASTLNAGRHQNPASPSTPVTSPQSHANNTSLYQCADCKRRYSRPEHLQRHIATHTLGKRFTCDVCGKAFGRADLLKRHRANHDDNDNGTKRRRLATSPGAGRVAHACQACAKARVKCEETKPCTRCRSRNMDCEYASSEAGSAAAMHLLHLSANARSHSTSSTEPATLPSQSSHESSPQSYRQAHIPAPSPGSGPPDPQRTNESPFGASVSPVKTEEGQPPTPDMMGPSNPQGFPPQYSNNLNGNMPEANFSFSGFLREIICPVPDPSKLAEAQGLAVLDFCDNANLDLNDIDFGILDHWNADGLLGGVSTGQGAAGGNEPPDMSKMRQRLVKVWTESPWRWNPIRQDTGYKDQGHLPVPGAEFATQFHDRVVIDKLDASGRDKILAIVLSTCQKDTGMMSRVASSFPSAEVMDSLIHIFLASHLCQISEWIDYSSFKLNEQCPEWLACAASAGAVLMSNSTLRKFGFALQEAVRVTIPFRFENNNTKIGDLQMVQALILLQDIALWSGNRRKMEIAECHLSIPITMIRYRGKFQRSFYPLSSVSHADSPARLEEKWAQWREKESWKRLVFHCYLRDAQTSITTLTPPHMSYAELTLPLPEARHVWFAQTATEWRINYVDANNRESKRPPSLGDVVRDVSLLTANRHRLDVPLAVTIYLNGFWSLIWEFRQLNAVQRSDPFSPGAIGQHPNAILSSRHQGLVDMLQNFHLATSAWHEWSAQESLILNLLQMNLHVSLDDLQLFSGKEGEDQARRIYPTLQRWCEGPDSRLALWHAGQILAWAKLFPPGHLKDFYAVAVHHAALALWTWGVVRKASSLRRPTLAGGGVAEYVFLDGPDSNAVRSFIGFGQGHAAIRGASGAATAAVLEDPLSCMGVAQDVLTASFVDRGRDGLPPIVENLCHLIQQLGDAAWAVGLG